MNLNKKLSDLSFIININNNNNKENIIYNEKIQQKTKQQQQKIANINSNIPSMQSTHTPYLSHTGITPIRRRIILL